MNSCQENTYSCIVCEVRRNVGATSVRADLNPYRLGHINLLVDYAVDRRRRVAYLIVEPILGKNPNWGGMRSPATHTHRPRRKGDELQNEARKALLDQHLLRPRPRCSSRT